MCPSGILGIIGRRTEDELRTHSSCCRRCAVPIGGTKATEQMRRRTRAGSRFVGQGRFFWNAVGRRCTKARDQQTTELATQTSVHMVSSVGIFYPRLSLQDDVHVVWPFSHLPCPLLLRPSPTRDAQHATSLLIFGDVTEHARIGRLKKRATPVERVMSHFCQEHA